MIYKKVEFLNYSGLAWELESAMDVAERYSSIETPKQPCDCYKVSGLSGTILETSQAGNLKDRYVLGEPLGWGQFGVIRVCSDKLTGELLACKSISKDRLITLDDTRSVKLEIEIMTRLSGHPNVVDLKAVYEDEDYVHLVMELCAGGELFHWLEKHGRFSETEARILFRHLMQVVLYCHEIGVVHRDLKPENILLTTKASSSQIKLADFGLATYIKPGQSLRGTVGSPFYIAPEVLAGGYNQAADVWSAGVILYILLSGTPPFWGKTKSRIFDAVRTADLRFPSDPWDRISESAKNLVKEMLNTDPSQRLTAQQVLDHSWMKDDNETYQELDGHLTESHRDSSFGVGSFSFSRDQDISFGIGSPVIPGGQSPALTSKISFSSSVAEQVTTTSHASNGFCFEIVNSDAKDFSSPIPSMPSFSFFSPSPVPEKAACTLQFCANIPRTNPIHGASGLGELLMLNSSYCYWREARETGTKDARIAGGFTSKRNHTIGFGEREELNLMVSESVIRWASCTNLPTAASLMSSLVC